MADSREAKADVGALQRRGRRRLVGAIALVLLAVIVLPMVFDPAPKPTAPPVSVRIPSEDVAEFRPRVTPRVPAPSASSQESPAGAAPEPKPAPVAVTAAVQKPSSGETERTAAKPPVKSAELPAQTQTAKAPAAPGRIADDGERRRAEDALAGTRYIVPVIALASAEKLKELLDMLNAANVPHYTEQIATSRGPVTRVRAGPFESQKAAEQMLEKLKGLGLKPGSVTTKS